MTSTESSRLDDERSKALDISKPTGAMIVHSHLDRRQEVVGVTKDDLEDILGFDGVAAFFGAFGVFMLSGSVWLIVENALDADGFDLNTLMAFCIASAIFGAAFLGAAAFFHSKKRGRIKRIFSQTTAS